MKYCDICDSLNGAEWVFDTDKPFPSILTHPVHGIVWDCNADESRAHGPSRLGCYCTLSCGVPDDEDLAAAIRKVTEELKEALRDKLGKLENWTGVGWVSVVRQDGRFVTWSKA